MSNYTSVMDSIEAAQKSNIIPDQEFILQGGVLDSSVSVLMSRLRGLCDGADQQPEMFHDHEIAFILKDHTGNKSALLRNCLDIPVSSNVCDFLHELGGKVDHEFVVKGYILTKGRIKVTVFKIFKVLTSGAVLNKDNLESINKSHAVELSVLTTRMDEAIAEELKIMADQLRPLVNLQGTDYRRL